MTAIAGVLAAIVLLMAVGSCTAPEPDFSRLPPVEQNAPGVSGVPQGPPINFEGRDSECWQDATTTLCTHRDGTITVNGRVIAD